MGQAGIDQSGDAFPVIGEASERVDGTQHASFPGTSDLSGAWIAARHRLGGDVWDRARTELRLVALARLMAGGVAPRTQGSVCAPPPGVQDPQLRVSTHARCAGGVRSELGADDSEGRVEDSLQRGRLTPRTAAQALRHGSPCPSRSMTSDDEAARPTRVLCRARVPRALLGAVEEAR